MVDSVTTQILEEGIRNIVMKFTNVSDATGESAVTKVDPTILTPACRRLRLNRIIASTKGMGVIIYWDGAVDMPILIVPPDVMEEQCFTFGGGLAPPPGLAAPTGKIQFTTVDAGAAASYSITLEMTKKYEAYTP